MKIRNKLLVIVAIPSFAILLIFFIGLTSFFRIENFTQITTKLQNDKSTMIDADRDAYQAFVSSIKAGTALNIEEVNTYRADFDENVEQTWDRILGPSERFENDMQGDFNNFKEHYNIWKSKSLELFETAKQTSINGKEREDALIKAEEIFTEMRAIIDTLGAYIDDELLKNLSSKRRLDLERALSLVLNGDRDAYQAYVASLEIIKAGKIDKIIEYDESTAENMEQTYDRFNQAAEIYGLADDDLINQFNELYLKWNKQVRIVVDITRNQHNNFQKILELDKSISENFSFMRDSINKLGELQVSHVDAYNLQMNKLINSTIMTYIVIFIIALILSVLIALIIASKIISSLNKSIKVTEELALGDLTVNVDIVQDDEIGDLANSLRTMIDKLYNVVSGVLLGSDQIASASELISEGNQDLAVRTEEQASALEETSAAVEEMNSSIRSNADNTSLANNLSKETFDKSVTGSEAVNKMIEAMNEINVSSQKISDIIEVINSIAFQTNLLALNASIEAARAGELGKGFAVVAVEVRKLAKKSDKAAAQVSEIIKESNLKVEEGVGVAKDAGNVLVDIQESVKKVTLLISEIAEASKEQIISIDQIDSTLRNLDTNTQKNSEMVTQAAASTEELSAQAKELSNNMKYFNIHKTKSLTLL
ncbi:MAG: HAMP domain-containing protein [Spirochaetales bacterium]|nr:HAMP domain-containing protein [Spirochaetales bacterium]